MEFKQAIVTKQGRELMAKLLNGQSTKFTSIKVSSTVYQDGQLENLTALTNIKQETVVQVYENNTATISAIGAIENTGLQIGYYINTVGLYAIDPDKGEILYSVSSASVNGYMPPDTGVSKSGFNFKIYSEVGNASQVDLTVDPAAVATHADISNLRNDVAKLKQAWSNSVDGTDNFGKSDAQNLLVTTKNPKKIQGANTTNQLYTLSYFQADKSPFSTLGIPVGTEISFMADVSIAGTIGGEFHIRLGSKAWQTLTPNGTRIAFTNEEVIQVRVHTYVNANWMENFYIDIRLDNVPIGATVTVEKVKMAVGDTEIYTPNPIEATDPLETMFKYRGLAVLESDNPTDYVWSMTNEYMNYLFATKAELNDLASQVTGGN